MAGNIDITSQLQIKWGFTPDTITNPLSQGGIDAASRSLLQGAGQMFGGMGDLFSQFADLFDSGQCGGCFPPVSEPSIDDSSHPSGSLKADGDVVTTPGGYQIEMLGQHEWKITGPDGKSTRIWGDPHVEEGDGGKWDFKNNSTFVLPDGTRINCTTVPGGAEGMTVTGSLEIINGNDRVVVSDIDKGKGRIGTVTQDGFQHVNSFDGDAFVMGQETDDWAYTGKEITGSRNGGESFELGGELHPLANPANTNQAERFDNMGDFVRSMFDGLMNQWQDNMRPNRLGSNPYSINDRPSWEDGNNSFYDRRDHQNTLGEAFRALADMFSGISRFMSLADQLSAGRNRPIPV